MNPEPLSAHTDRVLAEVRGEWHAMHLYACELCGLPSVDGKPHRRCLLAAREAVSATITVKELGAVLGVNTAGAHRETV